MRFLVTGGAGFIGSHIVERLLKDGHYVRVLDNFSSGKRENLSFVIARSPDLSFEARRAKKEGATKQSQNFELIEGDIRDAQTCFKACEDIDYVLHQSALRSVPKSMTMPHEYNAVNIDGTVNILEAALKSKVKRVVMASSSSVYGNTDIFPEKESDAPLLISPYALTKLAAEYYGRVYSENFGLETVNLRYFNVFGPRQSLDDEYAVVIPKFITCMLSDKQPPIHGNGKQSRDFTYVENVVEANILAATTPMRQGLSHPVYNDVNGAVPKAVPCHVFNVACGQENSVLDLVDTINKILGKSIKPILGPVRAGDVFRTLADISKIKKLLGYRPAVNFEEGLRKTIEWFRKQTINI
jgi:nucleoside-diphosphate-sugar epimerase